MPEKSQIDLDALPAAPDDQVSTGDQTLEREGE
jgi:hypothetical protein